jgi:hypothetical protein
MKPDAGRRIVVKKRNRALTALIWLRNYSLLQRLPFWKPTTILETKANANP